MILDRSKMNLETSIMSLEASKMNSEASIMNLERSKMILNYYKNRLIYVLFCLAGSVFGLYEFRTFENEFKRF